MDGLPWWTWVFFLPAVALFAFQVWAAVDGIAVPASHWHRIHRPKVLWLIAIWITAPVGSLYYLLRLRSRLRDDEAGNERTGGSWDAPDAPPR